MTALQITQLLPVINGDVAAVFEEHSLSVYFIASIAMSLPVLESRIKKTTDVCLYSISKSDSRVESKWMAITTT